MILKFEDVLTEGVNIDKRLKKGMIIFDHNGSGYKVKDFIVFDKNIKSNEKFIKKYEDDSEVFIINIEEEGWENYIGHLFVAVQVLKNKNQDVILGNDYWIYPYVGKSGSNFGEQGVNVDFKPDDDYKYLLESKINEMQQLDYFAGTPEDGGQVYVYKVNGGILMKGPIPATKSDQESVFIPTEYLKQLAKILNKS
jgi:hypothetical protein